MTIPDATTPEETAGNGTGTSCQFLGRPAADLIARDLTGLDNYGPGFRVYFIQRGKALVILLAGGDKQTQDQDIATAIELARQL